LPTFTCDLSRPPCRLEHFWEHTIGSGHAPLALRADWQAQLTRCRTELGIRHVRFHGLLSDDMGTLICQNEELLYSFFNADQIMDFLLSIGMKPFVELSFMPATLASGPETVFRYRGNITPPTDFDRWATLIRKLVGHWAERYGVEEIRQWFFEVWNEPNLHYFWTSDQAAYFKLYRYTAEAIKEVDASLRVGGPATAQNAWIAEFLEFCERHGVPADFVTTHYYPTDAFGQIGADSETQLAHAARDVMRRRAQEAQSQAGGRNLYYTEWNTSSNPRHDLHDRPAAAAYATHILMGVRRLVQGYSLWTFSDIFAENYFPSIPFHGGFGLLTIHDIPKPIYRAYQLLHRLGNEELEVDGEHATVESWAVRKPAGAVTSLTLLLVNDAQPRHPIQTELVRVRLTNARAPHAALVERIDDDHANPRGAWEAMGQPKYLGPRQVEELQMVSQLRPEATSWRQAEGAVEFELALPPHSLTALTVEFAPPEAGRE
jgi:xylan 1,4-beta-xylosidase